MKKLLAVLTVSALVLGIGVAQASFSAGAYKGKTQWKKPVSFTASKTEVTKFKIRVQYGCTDGDAFWTTESGFPAMKIKSSDKFGGKFANSDGSIQITIKGKLTGKTAKGSYFGERTYNSSGELDPDGNITCYRTKETWKAKKRS